MKNWNEPGYGNNPSEHGPLEHRPFVIMIPVSKIWKWFKKRKKNKEKKK